jgi:integrase
MFVRVIARASTTKNHKEARIRLHPTAVAALREYLSAKVFCGTDPVFADLLPEMDEFRIDLERAEIPFIDENGYRADFHSLRHTFCTRLQNADVSESLCNGADASQ